MSELMLDMTTVSGIVLILVFFLILFQEAVNGFHDVANAIATVIYSNAMKPFPAVLLAGSFNFLGVMLGGTAVAFSLVYLLPVDMVAGINTRGEVALFLAMIVGSVIWNFGTWWLGIPNSTTHAYIGSIIGASMANAFVLGQPVADQINWHQGEKILLALVVSPIVGFLLGAFLLYLQRWFVRDKAMYEPVHGDVRPPMGIRGVLIAGSAGVSLMHGSNDGQKSIGLMMVVLFGLFPAIYGLDPSRLNAQDVNNLSQGVAQVAIVAHDLKLPALEKSASDLQINLQQRHADGVFTEDETKQTRAEILTTHTQLTKLMKADATMAQLTDEQKSNVAYTHKLLSDFVEHVPIWVILLSALALGGGTLVGYNKIVTTLGEKMGSSRMNPAQGTAAQLSAVASIALADLGGLPVSTTHVLSSAVVGTVAVSPGQSVNRSTISKILMTWVTTLPGTLLLSFALGVVFYTALV